MAFTRNVVPRPFHRQRTRQGDHTALAGAVVAIVSAAVPNQSRHRGDVDDRAAALGHHGTGGMFAAQERAAQVDAHQALPVLKRQVLQRGTAGDAGVVHQDVQAPEALHRRCQTVLHLPLIADVDHGSSRLAAGTADLRLDCRQVLGIHIHQHHLRPGLRQPHCNGASQPAARPGHQRRPAVQPEGPQDVLDAVPNSSRSPTALRHAG